MERIDDFEGIIVIDITRYGRSVKDLVADYYSLKEKGKSLHLTRQNIDTNTKEGRLLFHMLGSIAEYERELITERLQAGHERAREKGVKYGRKRKPVDLKLLAFHYNKGASWRWLSNTFDAGTTTIGRWLQEARDKGLIDKEYEE